MDSRPAARSVPAWLLFSASVSAAIAAVASCGRIDSPPPPVCESTTGTAIFEQRIAPLLADDQPKSCNTCHLSGIDMSLFVRPTPCETMACLNDLGLVDLEQPEASRVLDWISRADPASPLITERVIDAEYSGFLEWIRHYGTCGSYECGGVQCGEPSSDPFCAVAPEPDEVTGPGLDMGGCSELEIERLFRDSVYASRGRCFPCHFDKQLNAAPGALRFIEQEGSCDASSLSTLRNILDAGLVDVEAPEKSLLILKPLSEEGGGVPHGGHAKFFPDSSDPGYENFLYWITRYAECQAEKG